VHLSRETSHFGWDNSLAPSLTVSSGDTITLDTIEASGDQLTAASVAADLVDLDFGRLNPVTGPIEIRGAQQGDAIAITIDEIDVDIWGWTAALPGFGLLADQFPDPYLAISRSVDGFVELPFGPRIPIVPMIGTIGLALPERGHHSVVPPRRHGGNLDIRHLTPGSTLVLPVGVEGALLSLGDIHAAMGDGEVCGTGVETNSRVSIRVELQSGRELPFPIYTTSELSERRGSALATTGVGPDLMQATRDAVSGLIDEVTRRTGLSAVEAYLLASLAGDLKISEIVDAPNWVVSIHLPLNLLD